MIPFFLDKFLLQGSQACVKIYNIDRNIIDEISSISQGQDEMSATHFVDMSRKTADHNRRLYA